MEYSLNNFEKDLEVFDLILEEEKKEKLIKYYELLVEWNEKINLTAITEFDEVLKKHFLDSLSFVKVLDLLGKRKSLNDWKMIDVGTGAGFPGIPLKILYDEAEITLLDSLNKRIHFLDETIHVLDLKKITTVHGRAEDLAKPGQLREKFDFCVSRAVANLSVLSEYCIPFVKKGGYFVAYKSDKTEEEMKNAKKAIAILGGEIADCMEFLLPGTDMKRTLIVIKKVKNTNIRYPRKAGMPTKNPLS